VGVADDAAVVIGAMVGAGGDEHVPAVPAGICEDPWVTPGLLVPVAAAQPLVPAVVGGDQRGGRCEHIVHLDPGPQVVGHGMPDRGSAVAPPFVLQGPGGEQEEQVVAVTVIG
jgi:hypothetical protein